MPAPVGDTTGRYRAVTPANGESSVRFTKDTANKTGMSERTIQREWAIMRQTLNCHAAKSAL
jgi:hypothetical protein